jgi:hypothetical protein
MTVGAKRFAPLAVALALAAVFHLSMVSIFSIVITVPRATERFSSLDIVKLPAPSPPRASRRGQLRLRITPRFVPPAPNPALNLPEITLPRLELPDLQKEQTEEQRLQISTNFAGMFEEPAQDQRDSWAAFTQELRDIGRALTGMPADTSMEPEVAPIRVNNVAQGFDLEVRWLTEPKQRRLLFSPPIEALWRLESAQIPQPITLSFIVDPEGKVTDVQAPADSGAGIVGELEAALRQYRFESLALGAETVQQGALILSAEERQE